jgi:hypothetical protein
MVAAHRMIKSVCPLLMAVFVALPLAAAPQSPGPESDYYSLVTIPAPKDTVLELSGVEWLDTAKTRLAVCTRRGELWVLDNVYAAAPVAIDVKDAKPADTVAYKRMLFGLHEPLGMVVNPGHGFPKGIYMAQRGELTRCLDEDGDDLIDLVETFCNEWEISGSYHEYAFGPKLGKDGRLWVTLNRPFGGGEEPQAYWRAWAVAIDNAGKMHPVCPGVRSPAGLGTNSAMDMFYTDNQGDHVAVCKLSHLKPNTFHGNPVGLESLDHPLANFSKPFADYPKLKLPWGEAVKQNPMLAAPAVWFPYPQMGRSHTDVIWDSTQGGFGPFAGQLFVGDLSTAQLIRCYLEKVDGEYQGACFPFRSGFEPPVLRAVWGHDGSLFIGGSSRGWGGGAKAHGLQRLMWTGKLPFECKEMRITPTGFKLVFTEKVDVATASAVASYACKAWHYTYDSKYGDDPHDVHDLAVTKAVVDDSGMGVLLTIEGLKEGEVVALQMDGVANTSQIGLLHKVGYYTLNRLPR